MSSANVRISGKRVRDAFFSQDAADCKSWICRCGKKRRVTGTGYTNFVNHVREMHPVELNSLCNGATTTASTASTSRDATSSVPEIFLWKRNAVKVNGWMEYIVHNLLPFDSCEKKTITTHIKYAPMALNTFMKYIERLMRHVEKKVASLLPEKFAVVFDGWSHGGTYYVAIFATYPSEENTGYSSTLLSFSPLGDEKTHSAQEHFNLIEYVTGLFNKSITNIVAVIADNCATNRALSRMVSCGFVGCSSHRYNLAVKDVIHLHTKMIEQIKQIMSKLCFPLRRAKLREMTDLSPVKCNETRWSSMHVMLKRYVAIREFLPKLMIEDVDELLLSRKDDQQVDKLLETMAQLDSITLCLQRDDTTMAQVRVMFDTVIEHMPNMENRLKPDADIVESKEFEAGIVHIQQNRVADMTEDEKCAVKIFSRTSSVQEVYAKEPVSLAEVALQKFRAQKTSAENYMDLRFIVPTSNMCERLFSQSRRAVTDYRKSMSPVSLEAQMFLYGNSNLWSIHDVNEIVD